MEEANKRSPPGDDPDGLQKVRANETDGLRHRADRIASAATMAELAAPNKGTPAKPMADNSGT